MPYILSWGDLRAMERAAIERAQIQNNHIDLLMKDGSHHSSISFCWCDLANQWRVSLDRSMSFENSKFFEWGE